jgi:hypothetical protein
VFSKCNNVATSYVCAPLLSFCAALVVEASMEQPGVRLVTFKVSSMLAQCLLALTVSLMQRLLQRLVPLPCQRS